MLRIAVITLALALAACATQPAESPPAPAVEVTEAPAPETTKVAVDGAKVYAANCAVCHGAEGRGDGPGAIGLNPPAADLVGPRADHLRGIPRRKIIEEGRPGTAMVGWKTVLSPEALDAVYTHVHNFHHGPGGGGHGRGGGH